MKKFCGVWKIVSAVILSCIVVLFAGCGGETSPSFNYQNSASQGSDADKYGENVTYNNVIAEANPLDYARNQLNSSGKALYDIVLGSLRSKQFTIVSGLDGYTTDDVFTVAEAVFMDHPELCWYDGTCTAMSNAVTGEVTKISFEKGAGLLCEEWQIDSIQQTAENAAAGIIATAKTFSDDYSKALYVHDELISRISYDTALAAKRHQNESEDVSLKCSMYGALVENSTVCQGYVQAYQYIMKELGIECVNVSGTGDGANHGWNLIRLEGDYYYVDLTWDDPIPADGSSEIISHTYCFVTSRQMAKRHVAETDMYLPVATATACNYYVRSGLYLDSYSYEGAKACIKNAIERDIPVEIAFSDSYELSKAEQALNGGDYAAIMGELGYEITRWYYSTTDTVIRF